MSKAFKYLLLIIIAAAITLVFGCRKKRDMSGSAQITFQKMYSVPGNVNVGGIVKPTRDEGYIVAAGFQNIATGGRDFYLVRTDKAGNLLWSKTYGGIWYELPSSIQQTTDGGFIAFGSTTSFGAGNTDVYVIRTDGAGNLLWSKTFGGAGSEGCSAAIQTNDGGFIITGGSNSNLGMILIKIDADGNERWTKLFSNLQSGTSILQTPDGGFIIGGSTFPGSPPNSFDMVLIRTDSLGNMQWAKTYGGDRDDLGLWEVKQTNDGGYIMVGSTNSYNFTNYYLDAYVIRTDGNGNILWSKTYGSSESEVCWDVVQTSDGGFILLVETTYSSSAGPSFVEAAKTDGEGNLLWAKRFATSSTLLGSIEKTSDGGYIIISGLGTYLIKTDSKVNSGCNESNSTYTVSAVTAQVTNLVITGTTNSFMSSNPPTVVGNGGVKDSTLCFK